MIKQKVNIMMILLLFACANNRNSSKITANDSYLIITEDTVKSVPITTDEFIRFWDKFSVALLQNNISVLNSLVLLI